MENIIDIKEDQSGNGNTLHEQTDNFVRLENLVPANNCIPPKFGVRNEFGLLDNVNYIFNEHGLVDWRKMVSVEHLAPNLLKTKETDVTKCKDDELILLLSGVKHLASVRGFSNISYQIASASQEFAAVICKIDFIPNFETEGRAISFESMAQSNLRNTNDFGKLYLLETAENRAFSRCVRNFLRINVVSEKELGEVNTQYPLEAGKANEIPDMRKDAEEAIEKIMKNKKLVFTDIKTKLLSENIENADKFETLNDIPTSVLMDLIVRMKKRKKD